MSSAQQKALADHRRRRREDGMVRVEVQVPADDAGMLRELAAILRGEPDAAAAMRSRIHAVIAGAPSVSDIFGSALPDAWFDDVFEQRDRDDAPRDVEF
jgi:hypothetical protein